MKSDMDNYKYYDTVFPDERGNEDRTPRDIINEGGAWDDIKALKDNQRFVFFFDN
jgi:hypothetical protein